MTLRWRLTLVIAITVALVLLGSGIGLHYLLRASLYRSLDDSLSQGATLLSSFADTGSLDLALESALPSTLDAGLSGFVLDDGGGVVVRVGVPLARVPSPRLGFSDQGDLRVLTERAGTATVVVARDLDAVEDSIERFDASFLTLAPLAMAAAALLGYLLAGRGLAPVDRLTRAALDLALRRAWQERLPAPKQRDELWRLASATNHLLDALGQVIESERRFTADAAHELRTPITVLRGRLEQALEETSDELTRERLLKAVAANEELFQLTETLLMLARAEAGQDMLSFREIAMDEIVFDAAEARRPDFREKGIELDAELPEEPLKVYGNPDALHMLLRNLLDNALKFTQSGSTTLRVAREGEAVLVTVEDTGLGIPPEDLAKVFKRFYQANVDHRRTGSGLGLSLARSIAEWHGGRLEAANRPDGGARFTLVLPAANRGD